MRFQCELLDDRNLSNTRFLCILLSNRYLEAVEAIVKSQPKGSPYYNIVFLEGLKELTERLARSSLLTVTGYVFGVLSIKRT